MTKEFQVKRQCTHLHLRVRQFGCLHARDTMTVFTWARITFQKTFQNVIRPFPDFSSCERKAVSNQAFEMRFETQKKGVLDRYLPRNPDSRTCERKALSESDSCVCIYKMRAEAMHKRMGQSACADCTVGAKYYLAVRRS